MEDVIEVVSDEDCERQFWNVILQKQSPSILRSIQKRFTKCSEAGQDITAAVAVTPYQTEDYRGINWKVDLDDDEVAVVHILAVHPHFQKRGYAKTLMKEVIELARKKGLKSVRLDALECNVPAHRLYESLGLIKRDVRHWYASNTGWIVFTCSSIYYSFDANLIEVRTPM